MAGELDAIVASLPLDHDDLEEAAAIDDRFLLAAPAGSPHAARSPALADLIAADELLLLEDGHCLRDQALAVCHAIDPARLRSFGATSFPTLLQLVAAGHGLTLLPEMAVNAGIVNDPRMRVNRFAAPEPRRTIGLAWRRSSPRRRDFVALAEIVGEAGGGGIGGGRPLTAVAGALAAFAARALGWFGNNNTRSSGRALLTKTMQAVICHGPEDYRLDEVAGAGARPGRSPHPGRVGRHLRQRPQMLSRRAAVLGRRASRRLLPAAGDPRP